MDTTDGLLFIIAGLLFIIAIILRLGFYDMKENKKKEKNMTD